MFSSLYQQGTRSNCIESNSKGYILKWTINRRADLSTRAENQTADKIISFTVSILLKWKRKRKPPSGFYQARTAVIRLCSTLNLTPWNRVLEIFHRPTFIGKARFQLQGVMSLPPTTIGKELPEIVRLWRFSSEAHRKVAVIMYDKKSRKEGTEEEGVFGARSRVLMLSRESSCNKQTNSWLVICASTVLEGS